MDISNFYKILLPREVERKVDQTSIAPVKDIDPKVMQQLYQQKDMLMEILGY